MRETRPIGPILLALLPLAGASAAQEGPAPEPLFLRIRPLAPETGIGAGGRGDARGDEADAELVRRARAAREAVWARSQRNADRLIASVCTGCLKDWPARRAAPPRPDAPAAAAAPERTPPDAEPAAPESPRAPATAVATLDPTVPDPRSAGPESSGFEAPGSESLDPGSGAPDPDIRNNPGAEATP